MCHCFGFFLLENSILMGRSARSLVQDNYLKAVGRVLSGDGPVDKHKAAQADTNSLTDLKAEIIRDVWIQSV